MWHSYRTIAQEFLPNAVCSVDKFHVLQDFTRRFTQVRIKVMNQFKPLNDKPLNELKQEEYRLRYQRDINYIFLKNLIGCFLKQKKDSMIPTILENITTN